MSTEHRQPPLRPAPPRPPHARTLEPTASVAGGPGTHPGNWPHNARIVAGCLHDRRTRGPPGRAAGACAPGRPRSRRAGRPSRPPCGRGRRWTAGCGHWPARLPGRRPAAVARRLAVGNPPQRLPDAQLEGRPGRCQRQVEGCALAGEVLVQLPGGVGERTRIERPVGADPRPPGVWRQIDAGQASPVADHQQVAERAGKHRVEGARPGHGRLSVLHAVPARSAAGVAPEPRQPGAGDGLLQRSSTPKHPPRLPVIQLTGDPGDPALGGGTLTERRAAAEPGPENGPPQPMNDGEPPAPLQSGVSPADQRAGSPRFRGWSARRGVTVAACGLALLGLVGTVRSYIAMGTSIRRRHHLRANPR